MPPSEYLRVDEIAARYRVSVDDVLAACPLVGFGAAHDADSLIELDLFTHAILAAGVTMRRPTPATPAPRRPVLALAGAAAALLMVVVAIGVWRDGSGSPSGAPANAAAYRAQLKATYDAAVHAAQPRANDYRALARELSQLTPPAGLRAQHAKLVAEAENVANLAGASPTCADPASVSAGEGPPNPNCLDNQVSSASETASAANALQDHVGEVDGAPTP